jgi:hypothetical protein
VSKIFASTMLYGASKRLGLEKASAELMRQLGGIAQAGAANIVAVDDVEWWGFPAALTLARVAICGELKLHVNAGSTVIAKARSIAANEFLEDPDCAVWFSVDDDVVVSADAVAAMIEQCLREPCVVVAPCIQRGSGVVDVDVTSPIVDANEMQPIDRAAFGAVCFSRAAIERAHSFGEWEHEGKPYRAVFRDWLTAGHWWTEDKAFFEVNYSEINFYAVRRGFSTHAGQRLDLATLQPVVKVDRSPLVV